jgi:hypothetical protein
MNSSIAYFPILNLEFERLRHRLEARVFSSADWQVLR